MKPKKEHINKDIKILIVEDSPTQAENLKYILEESKYQVSHARNGKEALTLIKDFQPDIVITDVIMPEVDGYELTKKIREDPTFKYVPIMLLTALSDPNDVIKGLEAGANNFITKPYTEERLLSQIQYILINKEIRKNAKAEMGINVLFRGKTHFITSERLQILDLLLSTYESAISKNNELREIQEKLKKLNTELENMVEERTKFLKEEIIRRKKVEEELKNREKILEAIVTISEKLFKSHFLRKVIQETLEILLEAADVSRVYIFENHVARDGTMLVSQRYEAAKPGITPQITNPELQNFPYKEAGFNRWVEVLNKKELIYGNIKDFPEAERKILTPQNILSILIVPIFIDSVLWGFIGFDECTKERGWTSPEMDALKVAADIIGAAIERKRIEEELKKTEEKYRTVVEDQTDLISRFTPDGKLLFINDAYCRYFGKTKEELLKDYIFSVIYEEDIEKVKSLVFSLNLKNPVLVCENRVVTAKGEVRWTQWTDRAVFDKNDNLLGFQSVGKDIHDKKLAEERLKNQTKDLMILTNSSVIFSTIPVSRSLYKEICDFIVKNFDLKMVWLGLIEEGNFDVKPIAYAGFEEGYLSKIKITWDDKDTGKGPTGMAIKTRKPQIVDDILSELRFKPWKDEATKRGYRSSMALPLISIEGKILGALNLYSEKEKFFQGEKIEIFQILANQIAAVIENRMLIENLETKVKERTHMLELLNLDLKKLNAELELKRKEAEIAKIQAETANKAKSDFLANMSHELRTPLNSVIGFSEVLADEFFGKLNEKQKEYVKNIHISGKHLLELINDILDLAKVESGKMRLEFSVFLLKDVLTTTMSLLKERALKHNINMTLEMGDQNIEIEADIRALKQIMFNLLSNAVKFTPDNGFVTIKAKKISLNEKQLNPYYENLRGEYVEVSVEDTGIGIKSEDIGKLFKEFVQLESPYSKEYEGTGLGLALTKRLVELHKGRIFVESEYLKGSKFTFVIPIRQEKTE